MVARAAGEGPALLAQEAAGALAAFGDDPAGLVTVVPASRRPPTHVGPALVAERAGAGGRRPGGRGLAVAPTSCDADRTPLSPDVAAARRRGGHRPGLARADRRRAAPPGRHRGARGRRVRRGPRAWRGACGRADIDATIVPESGLGAAVASSTVVLLEAAALGPSGFVATPGSHAAAAVARHLAKSRCGSWPGWDGCCRARCGRRSCAASATTIPGTRTRRSSPSTWSTWSSAPKGVLAPADALTRADCPVAPELHEGDELSEHRAARCRSR